jgi:hypothetical protein
MKPILHINRIIIDYENNHSVQDGYNIMTSLKYFINYYLKLK